MLWYVDNAVGTSGNGQAWATAWKELTDIVWASVSPGDTIYLSGGSTSKTYVGSLVVGASGSAGNPITITKGIDAGHSGTVFIDSQNADIGINTNLKNHVIVERLSPKNTNDTCILVDTPLAGVIVQDCTPFASGPGGGNARGIDIRRGVGASCAIVRRNSITTNSNTTDQTDCIYAEDNDGVVIEDNLCEQLNVDTTGHSDCVQLHDCGDMIIRRNRCKQVNGGADNHGIWAANTRTGKTYQIYGNVVDMRGVVTTSAITHVNTPGFAGKALLYNNTVRGGDRGLNIFDAPAADELKNNIVVPAAGGLGVFIEGATPPSAANINNNLIYAPAATVADVNGVSKDWSQWQALGYDANGVNADPDFIDDVSGDFRLQDTSPAIDAGLTIGSVTDDLSGRPRPKNAGYDIGAFEAWLGTIDSAAARRAAGGLPFPLGPGITPSVGKGPRWRLQAAWGYAGLDVVAVTGALAGGAADIAADAAPIIGLDGSLVSASASLDATVEEATYSVVGDLAAAASVLDGVAENPVSSTGDLVSQNAAVEAAAVTAEEEFLEFLHPDADDDAGNWTNQAGGLPLYTAVDEAVGA